MDEPLTPMVEASAGVHELFTSLVDGGFTAQQALYIIGVCLGQQMFIHNNPDVTDL